MAADEYFVYILLCENGSYYTGYTSDLNRRLKEHAKGSLKCKYTRSFKPLRLAQHWIIPGDKRIAMKMERYIKGLSRDEKEKLIANPDLLEIKIC
jgi:putative endonuclease